MAFPADTNIKYFQEQSDPRSELGNFYSLSGELPAAISSRVFKKQNSSNNLQDELYDSDRKIITQMLHDSRITLSQREHISTSILNGK